MRTLIFTLALTSILLIIGIVGTLIGITHLVYSSSSRHHRPKRRDKANRQRKSSDDEDRNTAEPQNGGT
jgi:Mn2+/Fe2+ NRAMP family transporter